MTGTTLPLRPGRRATLPAPDRALLERVAMLRLENAAPRVAAYVLGRSPPAETRQVR
jgi:hypothetical protein